MTYVMSDLHGRWDLYTAMLTQISFSPEDRLYILGNIAGRCPGGIRIYKDILTRSNVHLLLGSHEHMLFHAITEPEERSLNGRETNRMIWYRRVGRTSQLEWDAVSEADRADILRLLKDLPLNIPLNLDSTRYLLCHASPVSMFRSYGLAYPDETEFAVWHRLEFWMNIQFPADVLICGHTPTAYYTNRLPMEITRIKHNVYEIDCGCADWENPECRLACLRLEDRKAFYTGTEDPVK